jgi:hypothetical protein
MIKRFSWLALLVVACLASAQHGIANAQHSGTLFDVPTRDNVTVALYWHPMQGASTTLVLFPGGAGGFGRIENGRPNGGNFLVRSLPEFVTQGYNVAIIGRPSDRNDLDYADRITDAHLSDIAAVLKFVKQQSAAPLWLIGTSRGTVSVAHAAIHLPRDALAGVVLSSSIVDLRKAGALPSQPLAAITVPVLVIHHARDACRVCLPRDVPSVLQGLTGAKVKKLAMVDGGTNPSGDACGPLHWHGYIGMEREAVQIITSWINNPVP